MTVPFKKVSGVLCATVAGSFVPSVQANVDREVCRDVCEPERCDTRITEYWYAFDADGNEVSSDASDVNRCKKQIGVKSGGECREECSIESVQPWGEPHAIRPDGRNKFLDEFIAENLMANVFAEDLTSECDTALVECDNEPPECTSEVDLTVDPPMVRVESCSDSVSGCAESTFTEFPLDKDNLPAMAEACDNAGNCRSCEAASVDTTPPVCVATFDNADEWHRLEDFEVDPPLSCWLVSCEDPLGDGDGEATGCVLYATGGEGGTDGEQPNVIQELEPVDGAACTIEVCDMFGNCSTCESPQLKYEDTDICAGNVVKTADGTCGDCAEDDDDCHCIKGDTSRCRDDGPINCYTAPFHDRCPGFQNAACLSEPFTPGCPVVNPCYPEQVYDVSICPIDAIRFCARNPYHYGCNEACATGAIQCDPDAPMDDGLGGEDGGGWTGDGGDADDACPRVLEVCPEGSTWVSDGDGVDGCPVGHCEDADGNEVAICEDPICADDEVVVREGVVGDDGCVPARCEYVGDIQPRHAVEGEACPESAACTTGYCTTEEGVCDLGPNCADDDDSCNAICYGVCAYPEDDDGGDGDDGGGDEVQVIYAEYCDGIVAPDCADGEKLSCNLMDDDCQTCNCVAEDTICEVGNPNCGEFDTLCTFSGVEGSIDECMECRCVGDGGGDAGGTIIAAEMCDGAEMPDCADGQTAWCDLDATENCQTCACYDDAVACTADALVCDGGAGDMICPTPGCQGNGSCRCVE